MADFRDHPGSSSSLFNKRLSTGNAYTSAGAMTGLTMGAAAWQAEPAGGYPIYYAKATDPLVTVMYGAVNMWSGLAVNGGSWSWTGNGSAKDRAIKAACSKTFPTGTKRFYYMTSGANDTHTIPPTTQVYPAAAGVYQIRCPVGVTPCRDTDAHIAIYQPNGWVFEGYAVIICGDGTICCGTMNLTNPAGLLDGNSGGLRATLIPNYAGTIKQAELAAGAIKHAISINVPGGQCNRNAPMLPATAKDASQTAYTGRFPIGTRFALPWSFNVGAQSWSSAEGQILARAVQNYGMVSTDTGGGGITFYHEGALDATFRYDAAQDTDFQLIRSNLMVAT